MFLNSWSIALSLNSLIVIFLVALAGRTSLRVLFYWDVTSDSNRQIRLENETWLASTLIEYALGFQIVSLVVFILAADHFSTVIVGAMCATGSLTANSYGLNVLFIKIAGVFFYGLWIVVHHIDISSEQYPLIKFKYIYLLFLFPIICGDIILQTLYIGGLEPDIITSCCAVVFGESNSKGKNLIGALNTNLMLPLFYCWGVSLIAIGLFLTKKWRPWLGYINGVAWIGYLIFSLVIITVFFSSYIYAMPYHRCPFCIMKPEYNSIGFVIYFSLLPAAFFAISTMVVHLFKNKECIRSVTERYQKKAALLSAILLIIFLCASSFHYLIYLFWGGEM